MPRFTPIVWAAPFQGSEADRPPRTTLIAVTTGQDFDTIPAAEIKRDDNIEFPAGNPDVKWHFDENRASRPPCDQPGVQWYVEELGEPMLGSPLGDLYKFTVKEVGGAGADVEVKIRGHVPVRRYRRQLG